MDFRAMLMKRKKPAKKVVVVSARHVAAESACQSVRKAILLLNVAGDVETTWPMSHCHWSHYRNMASRL